MKPELKLWMLNDKMWLSGIRANKWSVPKSWEHISWFATRNPSKWNEELTMYFDFSFALMIQKDHGWN